MSFTDVFGNQTLPPAEYGYNSLALTGGLTVFWPYHVSDTNLTIAKITEVTCQSGNILTLPDARQVSVGEDFLIRNTGANALQINNALGVVVSTVQPGAANYFYLTDNTTEGGLFSVIGFGVGTSTVDAASLVGYGIKALGASLNQTHPVQPVGSSTTIDATHRAQLVVLTGGVSTFSLTSAATLGNDFFTLIRNEGTGTLTIDAAGAETIDSQASIQVQPSESLMLVCTGTQWYSVGYGRSVLYQFTQLTKDVSAGGPITLTAAEASNKLLTFIGNPVANVTVIAPAIVAVYYTHNDLSTAHNIDFKTSAGASVPIGQGTRLIVLCDGTDMLSAQSATANSSVSLVDGSVASPALFFASQTNTGLYKYGVSGLGLTVAGVDMLNLDPAGATFSIPLEIASGGTASGTAAGARTNLGISATNTPNTPAGGIAATNVQGALNELDTEKLSTTAAAAGYVAKDSATGAASLPAGTTGQRPGSPATGQFRFNSTLPAFEGYNGSTWTPLSGEVTLATVQTLQNKVIDASNTLPSKLIPFTGSIGSNILTGSLAATGIDFRSASLTSGAITPYNLGALSINIPATSSLGLTTALGTNRIVFLVAYNAGSPVLCVVNASGMVLDETGVISPTTIGAASNSKNVVYSASAVSANSPYRVVGFVNALFTTGTGWNGLSLTQGAGGQSLISLQGRLWQNVSGSRALSTLYTNNTGREIFVSVGCGTSGTSTATFFCDGLQVSGATAVAASISGLTCSWAVPAGSTYQVTNTAGTITFWVELR